MPKMGEGYVEDAAGKRRLMWFVGKGWKSLLCDEVDSGWEKKRNTLEKFALEHR